MTTDTTFRWWSELKHQGLLISTTELAEYFDGDLPDLPDWQQKKLRDHVAPVLDGDTNAVTDLWRMVFEEILDYPAGQWQRGPQVGRDWSETLKDGNVVGPDWLWHNGDDTYLPIFVARSSNNLGIQTDDWVDKRLGVGRSKHAVTRTLEWMRRTDTDLALLTNGRQLRLLYAGLDFRAWCEWDVDQWFEAGTTGPQLDGLRKLLHREALEPTDDADQGRLLEAIDATREGQADLSDVLGERVRRAVELLIRSVDREALDALYEDGSVDNQDVYIAACRMVMRMVVILFAEARDLLPRDNDVYNQAYGLDSLHTQLEERAGGRSERLRHTASAWPRILALFRLVHDGSPHEDLPVPAYGGQLFRPGDQLDDAVGRALEVLEDPAHEIGDDRVFRLLDLLTKSETRVQTGGRNTKVEVPVDFSDLSTEYIGILYEGLLDYELKRADEPMVFLNVGDEPILPFDRLDGMTDEQLADLFSELGDSTSVSLQTDVDQVTASIDGESGDGIEPWAIEEEIAEEAESLDEGDGDAREYYERIFEWAKRAAIAAGLVPTPDDPDNPEAWTHEFKRQLRETARDLVPPDRIFMPGRWYLVRWGGTRKGSGTFYTPPALVVPTVERTLEPLCYETAEDAEGERETNRERNITVTAADGGQTNALNRTSDPSRGDDARDRNRATEVSESDTAKHVDEADAGDEGTESSSSSSSSSPRSLRPLRFHEPKRPEEILDLKICDPAMGSGSFLIGAVRYLTDALVESLHHYDCFEPDDDGERTIVRLADGRVLTEADEEPIPVPPDHPEFEEQLRGRLKRYVVERCIYGVDNDPLAVELGRMALWIETMDPRLPFSFLDHKLKVGNSLVGAWMDEVQDYPAVAFERSSWNGGDQNHDNGVHFDEDEIGPALKEVRNELMKPQLRNAIRAGASNSFEFMDVDIDPIDVHERVRDVFDDLHGLPVHETRERERQYRERIQNDPEVQRLREIFDTWCAIWFWPFDEVLETADAIEEFKRDESNTTDKGVLEEEPTRQLAEASTVPLPEGWMNLDDDQRRVLEDLRERVRFFHWELEFPDVFNPDRSGFDAVLGNPPWEIEKPNSKEFFSTVDPLYRSYGKQEALDYQQDYFRDDRSLEREWLEYNAEYKSLSNWCKNRAHPWADADLDATDHDGVGFTITDHGWHWRESRELQSMWLRQRKGRSGFAEPEHPFRHQGSADTNSYKLFLEMAHSLDDEGGRLGFIVPSGIYTDYGTQQLRELLMEQSRWEWLFSFENKKKIFQDVDGRFKFGPVIVEKGRETDAIRASFMHHDVEDWEEAEAHVLDYPRERILQFSPNTKSILELRSERDLEILEKIYDNGVLLGDDSEEGWGIEYATEFHMTNDSDKFDPRPDFEEQGYRPDEYGHWLKGDWRPVEDFGFDPDQHRTDPHRDHWLVQDRPEGLVLSRDGESAMSLADLEDVALPLYEGRMVEQFDFSSKYWKAGKAREADWKLIDWDEKALGPQYLMKRSNFLESEADIGLKIGFLAVGSATNKRSLISSTLYNAPAGNSVPLLAPDERPLALCAALNSFVYDFALRKRMGGVNLNYFIVEETALPKVSQYTHVVTGQLTRTLNLGAQQFAPLWQYDQMQHNTRWRQKWAISEHERVRIRSILDAILAASLNLKHYHVSSILTDTDHDLSGDEQVDLPRKGFWRVDKEKPPELRHTVLAQVAFQDLQETIDRMSDREAAIATFAGQRHLLDDPPSDGEVPDHPHLDPSEGWMLPDQLRLADYDLGHDTRAEEPQPVASELGPRYYDWQLAQDPDESWEECRQHAELIEQIVPTPEDEDTPEDSAKTDDQEKLL